MDANDEYVRSVWERAEICERYNMTSSSVEFALSLGGRGFTKYNTEWRPTEAEAWSIAAEFTRERLEQVRQLKRDIDWARQQLYPWEMQSVQLLTAVWSVREECTVYRILARLEAALADLTKGMKPDAL